jgi:hypothetical protein
MNKTSKEVLTESLERRMKHMMVQLLNQFDDRFADLGDTNAGRLFKFDIKNQFNDAIRATRDEIRDYDVEYRPVRFNPDNTLSVTKTFIEGVQAITFDDLKPGMDIYTADTPQNLRILHAIQRELGGGIVYKETNGGLAFRVRGLEICINSVIPFMDLYNLLTDVRIEYVNWKKRVISLYINGDRNGSNI